LAIDASELDELRAQVRHLKNRDAIASWLQDARTRLGVARERGRLREIASSQQFLQNEPGGRHPELRCLRDFLDETRGVDLISCCDDRWVSRVGRVGCSQIVGMFDYFPWLFKGLYTSIQCHFANYLAQCFARLFGIMTTF
jgi:hypothetical protein